MELLQGGQVSLELTVRLVDNASQKPANHQLKNEEKWGVTMLTAGFGWSQNATRRVKSGNFSAIARRAFRNPRIRELRKALRGTLHPVWSGPPELSVGNPHRWRDVISTPGLSNRASGESSNKLFSEVSEMVIFPRSRSAPRYSRHPRIFFRGVSGETFQFRAM